MSVEEVTEDESISTSKFRLKMQPFKIMDSI